MSTPLQICAAGVASPALSILEQVFLSRYALVDVRDLGGLFHQRGSLVCNALGQDDPECNDIVIPGNLSDDELAKFKVVVVITDGS